MFESDDLEVLKSAKTAFEAKLHKLIELIYKQSAAQGENASASGGNGADSELALQ